MERNDFGSVHLRASRSTKRGGSQRNERNFILRVVQPKSIIKHIEQLNSCAHIQGNAHIAQPYHRQSSNQIISLHFVHGKVGWVECVQGLASLLVSFPAGYIADKKGPFKMRQIADGDTISILHFIVYNPSTVFIDSRYSIYVPNTLAGRSGVSKIGGVFYALATILTTITLLYPQLFFQRDPGLQ